MSELSPQARAIIDAAQGADEPTLADKERVRAAVLAQVGVAGVAGAAREASAAGGSGGPSSIMNVTSRATSTPGAAPMSATRLPTKLVGLKVIVGVAIVGGISGYFLMRGQGNESAPATVLAQADEVPAELPSRAQPAIQIDHSEQVPVTREARDTEPAPDKEEASEPGLDFEPVMVDTRARKRSSKLARRAHKTTAGDSPAESEPAAGVDMVQALNEERTLIATAKRALDTGDVAAAMNALSEHATKFPRGILVQERAALRVVALCARGDTDKAANERARFLARWPDSPHADRLRSACSE